MVDTFECVIKKKEYSQPFICLRYLKGKKFVKTFYY